MYITEETKQKINELIPVLKEKQEIISSELEDLEQLKQKRNMLSQNLETIEKQYHLNLISKDKYELTKHKKEFEICELDLEILRRNVEINQRKLYLRRLDILKIMTKVSSEQSYIEFNNSKIQADAICQIFLENVVNESTEQLRFKQQILRLIVAYNKSHEDGIYNTEKTSAGENLYDLQTKIENSKNTLIDYNKIDLAKLSAQDLLSIDAIKLYEAIFSQQNLKKNNL